MFNHFDASGFVTTTDQQNTLNTNLLGNIAYSEVVGTDLHTRVMTSLTMFYASTWYG